MCAIASCVGIREQPWEPPSPILFDTQCPLLYSSAVLAGPKASGDSPSSSSSQKELPYLSLCGFWGLELRNEHSTVSALYISLLMCLRVITAHCRGLHSSVCEPWTLRRQCACTPVSKAALQPPPGPVTSADFREIFWSWFNSRHIVQLFLESGQRYPATHPGSATSSPAPPWVLWSTLANLLACTWAAVLSRGVGGGEKVLKNQETGWRNGSVDRSMDCFYKGPEFDSQPPCLTAHNHVEFQFREFSVILWTPRMLALTYKHHTHTIKDKFLLKRIKRLITNSKVYFWSKLRSLTSFLLHKVRLWIFLGGFFWHFTYWTKKKISVEKNLIFKRRGLFF